jgi:desulfoferrodoxin-like iron-binding protein
MANVKKAGEVYKCLICGNVVKVITAGGGELVCCGEPMNLQEE